MDIKYLKEYLSLCIKFELNPSWNGLSMFKEIRKGIH